MSEFSHISAEGDVHMVDVSDRDVTIRTASAVGRVQTRAALAIAQDEIAKGDVLTTAQVAGVMGAKRTSELIPMCHPLALHQVEVRCAVHADETPSYVSVEADVRTADRTGVEMEALTAVTVAALTIIDMTKSVDPAAKITDVRVVSKTGGRSGDWSQE